MRQVGVIAAGALYALEHHVDRLADDHASARLLADGIREIEGLELRPPTVDTNLVIYRVDPRLGTGAEFAAQLKRRGLLISAFGGQLMRAVTHLDVNEAGVKRAIEILREVAGQAASQGTKPSPKASADDPYGGRRAAAEPQAKPVRA